MPPQIDDVAGAGGLTSDAPAELPATDPDDAGQRTKNADEILESIAVRRNEINPSGRRRVWTITPGSAAGAPVPCGQSRETVKRSEFAGHAGYGYCRSHSRWFWGFRLYLLCAGDGMPIGWELAAANIGERTVAAEMLDRVAVSGHTVIADKNFVGREFETLMAAHGARFLRPDRKNEPHRHGSLGPVRQWIESTFWTMNGQLALERHGARTIPGLATRVALRLLALAAGVWHNHLTGQPARAFAAYGR